jgi:hypothetical protein
MDAGVVVCSEVFKLEEVAHELLAAAMKRNRKTSRLFSDPGRRRKGLM